MYELRKELKVALFLAWKNIVFRKKTLAMVAIIIGLGFLSATFSSAVITGLRVMIENKAIYSITGNILIEPKTGEDYINNIKSIEKKIRSLPGVESISPRLALNGILYDPTTGEKAPLTLYIVDAEKEAKTTLVDDYIVAGRFISKGTKNGIVIGGVLTKKYSIAKAIPSVDVDAGDKVQLIIPGILNKPVKIEGIYQFKFVASETFGFINKEQAMKYLNLSYEDLNKASMILVKTTIKGNEKQIVEMMKQLNINAKIHTWEEKLGTIAQFTNSLQIISKITMIIGIIISFGTIYIMIYINVLQKRSQIGILKAIGINEKTILYSYIIQSMFYGIVGVITGYLLTYGLTQYFTSNPIHMPMGDIVPIMEFTLYNKISIILFIVSVFAGYFASKNIIKEPILDMIFKG